MKSIIFSLGLFLLSYGSNAQSEMYQNGMKSLLSKMEEAGQNAESYQEISNSFLRIAGAEKTEWLPKYYAAYTAVMQAMFTKEQSKVDGILDQADQVLLEIGRIKADDEIMCLQSFIRSTRIGVDPMTRGMKYGAESAKFLSAAKSINPNNPRIYFLQAQSAFYTPEQFGGGKKIAQGLFQTAIEKYNAFKLENELMPNWGKENAVYMLAECTK